MNILDLFKQTGRVQVYPVTFFARIKAFPYRYAWNKSAIVRVYPFACIVAICVMIPIHRALNSESNVQTWKKIRQARLFDPFDPETVPIGKH